MITGRRRSVIFFTVFGICLVAIAVGLNDSDRLLHTIDQVLRAGSAGPRFRRGARTRVNLAELTAECVALARTRFHLDEDVLTFDQRIEAESAVVLGDPDELKAAVWNL